MKKEEKKVEEIKTEQVEEMKTEQVENAELSEKERVKKEKAEWNHNRKVKRGLKALKGRGFKNFLLWFTGVISGLVILATTIFVAVGVVPLKTFFGDKAEESVSSDVANKSILGVLLNIEDYTQSYSAITSAFPVIDKELKNILTDVKDYVEIDFDAIKDVPFNDAEFSEKLMAGIKITATLKSLGADELLGDFSALPVFIDDIAIDKSTGVQHTVNTVDTTVENFDYHLYSYKDAVTGEFKSASNQDGTDWADEIKDTETPLYYASLLTMPFSHLTKVVGERFGVVKVADLVETFSEGAKDGIIGDILGDVDIASMGSFNPENIKVSVFLDRFVKDGEGNDTTTETDTYKMLRELLNVKESDGEILVKHFNSNFEFDTVKISAFLDRYETDGVTETETYELLRSIYNVPAGEEILFSHLNGTLSFDNLKVSKFIDRFETDGVTETGLYELLRAIFKVSAPTEITVSDLSKDVDFDGVDIEQFIDRYEADGVTETDEYEMLRKISGVATGDVTVKDLKDGLENGIKLSAFVDRFETDGVTETQFYKIIRTVFDVAEEEIYLSHLDGEMKLDKLALEEFIDRYKKDGSGNFVLVDGQKVETDLFRILSSVITPTGANGEILVGDIGSFNVDNVSLTAVIDKTNYAKLYDILDDTVKGTGTDGDILVKDLKNFEINDLEVTSIMGASSDLYKIVKETVVATGEGGKVLIGDLASFDINKLPVSEVIESTSKLYEILSEAVEGTGEGGEILVFDLMNSFDVTRVRLSTVIETTDNKILLNLIGDDSVTLANIGDKINALELKNIFEAECFTTDVSKAVIYTDSSMGRYRKVVRPSQDCHVYNEETCTCEQYVLESVALTGDDYYVDDNIYYINKETQIWLFMYYNDDHSCNGVVGAEDFDLDGFALSYKPMHLTFGNLESSVSKMSDEVKHASIRQLVSAGLMDPNPIFEDNGIRYIYAQTVNNAIAD